MRRNEALEDALIMLRAAGFEPTSHVTGTGKSAGPIDGVERGCS
jgi:hypothetical protein